MYGYSIRAAGNPEIYQAFEKRLGQLIDEQRPFDYPFLFSLIYYMLFRENADEKIWRAIIEATLDNDDTLPIMYYKPFRMARYFLEKKFPEWDISEFVERGYYADRYWNAASLD